MRIVSLLPSATEIICAERAAHEWLALADRTDADGAWRISGYYIR